MASGSGRRLIYITEATWGTTPATPTMLTLRNTGGAGLKLTRSTFKSAEMRSDRQIPFVRLGNKQASLEVPYELSDASYEDMIASAMFSAWDSAAITTTLTAESCTVEHDDSSYTRASGSWVTDGFAVGDRVRISGFVTSANNIKGVITVLTATKMTIGGATLTDETLAAGGIFLRRKQIHVGVTPKSFSIEEGEMDMATPEYEMATGMMVDSWNISAAPDAMITGTFNLIGKTLSALSTSTGATAVTAAGTSEAMDSFTGAIYEGGVAIAYLSGLSFALANGLRSKPALGSSEAYEIGVGRSDVSGSISAYFINATLANKFINETPADIEVEFADSTGKTMTLFIPSVKYTGRDKAVTEDDLSLTMPFQAVYDSDSLSNLIVEVA